MTSPAASATSAGCVRPLSPCVGCFIIVSILLDVAVVVAQPQTPGIALAGVVQDSTGAVLPGAAVELIGAPGAQPQTTTTDRVGEFRFEQVPPGTYEVRARSEGFKPAGVRVRVSARPPWPLKLVLPLAAFSQEVTVGQESGLVKPDTASNAGAIVVDQKTLEDLPLVNQDVLGAVSRFLDPGAIGTGGPTIVVDGVEVGTLQVSPSAIAEVKINKDPYAAEFSRPGGSRIEIVTKPGEQQYHGSAITLFRGSSFEARNALAAVRPPEHRGILEGYVGGPVGTATSFTLSLEGDADNQQAVVFAQAPSGLVQENAPTPYRYGLVAGTVTHQVNERNFVKLGASYEGQTKHNLGVGGVNLLEAASNWSSTGQSTTLKEQAIFTPKLLSQFAVSLGQQSERTASVSPGPRIVVQDAFTGGGAQANRRRTDQYVTLTEMLSWSPGRHQVKGGLNLPNWNWHSADDNTNTDGTFYFSSLSGYQQQRPYTFIEQTGTGHVAFLQKAFGLFIQDEIRVRSNLSVALGLRYDWQNYFNDNDNVAPRGSFVFAPTKDARTVIRGGAGLFYDRSGSGPIQDVLLYNGSQLQRYVITDPGYPNPVQPGQTVTGGPPSIVRLAPGVAIPRLLQYSVSVERQLQKSTTVSVTYTRLRGFDMFRSIDINAPLPPLYLMRPDPTLGVVRQIESDGTFRQQALQLSLHGQVTRFFNGSAQYTFSHARNDTGGINWMPPNAYDLSGEYARSDFDQRHRLNLIVSVKAGPLFKVGIALAAYSGKPYSITTGYDTFNDGAANARPPGVPRNSVEGPGYVDLDLRWSRDLWSNHAGREGGPMATVGVDVFNVLNRVNYSSYVGTLSSPFFGRAVSAEAPRRMQLSLRFKF
jgi:carboxypeptidase family protein